MSHIIYVNRQNNAMYKQDGKNHPAYTIKTKGHPKARYAQEVEIEGAK